MSEIRENGIQRLMRENGELRAQVAQLTADRRWEEFGKRIAKAFNFEGDLCGGFIQDLGVKCGVFVLEKYSREKHGPSDVFEDGDDYYRLAPPADGAEE